MGYQSTFKGRANVSQTNELMQIADALRTSITPALNKYADYKGKEITKKTTDEAEITARETDAKSYAEAVKNKKLDGTQSPYWQSVFDNQKGKAYGIQYGIQKQNSLNEWLMSNKADDQDWLDKDGSQYMAWSQDYDIEYFQGNLAEESVFFKKGLDAYVTQTNMNLGSSYSSKMQSEQKAIMARNLDVILTESFYQLAETGSAEELYEAMNSEGANSTVIAGMSGGEFNAIALSSAQAAIESLTIKGDTNADYEKAFEIIEAVQSYKRDNGSTLFNSETIQKWSSIEQTLYAEQEQHEQFLDNTRKELLQEEFIKDQQTILGNAFTGGATAEYKEVNAQKAAIAQSAFASIMADKFFNDPMYQGADYDTEEGKLLLDQLAMDVNKQLKEYYHSIDITQVEPFSITKFKNGNMVKGIYNLPLEFTDKAELEVAIDGWQRYGNGRFKELQEQYDLSDDLMMMYLTNQVALFAKIQEANNDE